MTDNEHTFSKRLREVWQWKEEIHQMVSHLPVDKALLKILQEARSSAEKVDLPRHAPSRTVSR